jgi:hypothetical protein
MYIPFVINSAAFPFILFTEEFPLLSKEQIPLEVSCCFSVYLEVTSEAKRGFIQV